MKKVLFLFLLLFVSCAGPIVEIDLDKSKIHKMEIDDGRFFYFNENFSFKVKTLEDFELEYLPGGDGILMKKWFEDSDFGYVIEIVVRAEENLLKYPDMNSYLTDRYPGFSLEFGEGGVYVTQSLGNDSKLHYYVFSEDMEILYELFLKVPRQKYSLRKNILKEAVNGFEIL